MADRLRVLIVDDDQDLRMLFRVFLEDDGCFEVVGEAGDGRTAVELAAACQPDVVLLDLVMPVMDGLEALPLLLHAAPPTKVVVLSAFAEATMAAHARTAGAVDYLTKGIEPADLVARLKAAVKG